MVHRRLEASELLQLDVATKIAGGADPPIWKTVDESKREGRQ